MCEIAEVDDDVVDVSVHPALSRRYVQELHFTEEVLRDAEPRISGVPTGNRGERSGAVNVGSPSRWPGSRENESAMSVDWRCSN